VIAIVSNWCAEMQWDFREWKRNERLDGNGVALLILSILSFCFRHASAHNNITTLRAFTTPNLVLLRVPPDVQTFLSIIADSS